ncbi:MAG: hypothetical protein SGJ27_26885 [Candidatus Melainabacteria bacterium]|nr:hypothetical protein [Candidatus Melainabacteria bacterium]
MFKIIVLSAFDRPSFLLDSSLSNFQIAREVARRFGYATMAPFSDGCFGMPHSWLAVDA